MSDIFPQVLEIVRSVRPLLLPHWGNVEASAYKTERYNSPVTELDTEAEVLLKKGLKTIDPGIAFVGEEGGGDRTAARHWLADPIDGTVAYIRGLPHCTTMLTLIEDGQQRFSVIYDFINDVLYYAEHGKGAYANKERIHVSTRSLPHATIGIETQDADLQKRLTSEYGLFKTMTAGHEFVQVATGKIEGRICVKPYGEDYDFAPGTLLVAEAGGLVANIGTNTYDYKNLDFIAANHPVFASLTSGQNAPFPIG